jgi:glycosyltransferase involved in cell wall biosynthesis
VAVREGWSGELLDDPANVDEIVAKLVRLLEGHHADGASIARSVDDYRWDRVLLKYESILEKCAIAGATKMPRFSDAISTAGSVQG